MKEEKVLRVVGLGSAANLDKLDPFNPINRRISIIVMNKRTEENVLRDGAAIELPVNDAAAAISSGLAAGAAPVPAAAPAAAKK
jgi:chemotaxis protein MotB